MVPNRISIEFATKIYLIMLGLTFFWCLLLVITPVFHTMGGIFEGISSILYWFYSPVCHQEEARSFFILGEKFAVCSRCSLLYFSFLAGLIVYPFVKKISDTRLPSIWFLIGASVLMFTDVILDLLDIQKNTFITRSLTGIALGFVLVFYLVPGFINFAYEVYSFLKFKDNAPGTRG